jgi:hypothetical protein
MKGAEAGERKYFLLDVKTALLDMLKAISSYLMLLTPPFLKTNMAEQPITGNK